MDEQNKTAPSRRSLIALPAPPALGALAISAAMVMGCSGAPASAGASDDEKAATTSAALNLGLGLWSWGTVDGGDLDVGPSGGQTCFLAGVAGALDSGYALYRGSAATAGAYMRNDGHYWVVANGGRWEDNSSTGNAVNAHVVCLGTVTNRVTMSVGGWGNGDTSKVPATPNRQCFLANVTGGSGSWSNGSDRVQLTNDGTNWTLSMNVSVVGSVYAWPGAEAVCVDIPTGTSVSTGWAGAPDPGVIDGAIGPFGSRVVCALTGIQGHFNHSSWTDGLMMTWPSSDPGQWTVHAENGKTASVTCMQ